MFTVVRLEYTVCNFTVVQSCAIAASTCALVLYLKNLYIGSGTHTTSPQNIYTESL